MMITIHKSMSLKMIGGYLLLFHTLLSEGEADQAPETSANADKIENYFDNFRKLNDACLSDVDCQNIRNGICDEISRKCECPKNYPVASRGNMCYEAALLNRSCVLDIQCEHLTQNSHCNNNHVCQCEEGYVTVVNNGTSVCNQERQREVPELVVDYTLLGILVGMAAMFIVMCVVLRMFSKARFQDQRTIFNSPRLLKISLARKTREDLERRGSRCSVASRQPSIYSGLNIPAKSPTGSQGSDHRSTAGSRRGSIQTPLEDRRARNADQVIVDIRGKRDNPGPKVNKV